MNRTLSKLLAFMTVLTVASVALGQDGTATSSSLLDFSSPITWLIVVAAAIFFPIWVSWGGLKIIFPGTG